MDIVGNILGKKIKPKLKRKATIRITGRVKFLDSRGWAETHARGFYQAVKKKYELMKPKYNREEGYWYVRFQIFEHQKTALEHDAYLSDGWTVYQKE